MAGELSEDGQWMWDGSDWVPNPNIYGQQAPVATPTPVAATPSPQVTESPAVVEDDYYASYPKEDTSTDPSIKMTMGIFGMISGLIIPALCLYVMSDLSDASTGYEDLAKAVGFEEDDTFKSALKDFEDSLSLVNLMLWIVLALGVVCIIWSVLVQFLDFTIASWGLVGTSSLMLVVVLISAYFESAAFTDFFAVLGELDAEWALTDRPIWASNSMKLGYLGIFCILVFLPITIIGRKKSSPATGHQQW